MRTKSSVRGRRGGGLPTRGRGSEHPITPSCRSASIRVSGKNRMLSLWSGMHCVWDPPAQGAWMGCGPRFGNIPPIHPVPRILRELHNAIECGDPMLMAKIGGFLEQGVSVLSMVGSGFPKGQTDTSDDEICLRGSPGE